jgi:hypothetical protein
MNMILQILVIPLILSTFSSFVRRASAPLREFFFLLLFLPLLRAPRELFLLSPVP